MKATYTARAIRSGDWWAITVDEIRGVHSQARRLDQVEDMARDAIALMLEVAPDSFDITVLPELPADWTIDLHQLQSIRTATDALAAMATMKATQTVHYLHDQQGLPMRDIGKILGISHQRVHQILTGPGAAVTTNVFAAFSDCVDIERVDKAKSELGIN